jgi:hypothetical protein
MLQLLNAREKVFRPQGIFLFRKRSRRQPVADRAAEEVTGFCIFKFS